MTKTKTFIPLVAFVSCVGAYFAIKSLRRNRTHTHDVGSETSAAVLSVSRSEGHHFSKTPVESIELIEGLGVEHDAHKGRTVQHVARIARTPDAPNLRQVHLVAAEVLESVSRRFGKSILPGNIGENITTTGLDLIRLPRDTLLCFGNEEQGAVVKVTGLRHPCPQISAFQCGLQEYFLDRDDKGEIVTRYAGIMGVVVRGGKVKPGDVIMVKRPPTPFVELQVV